jgi:hypothetical protein
MSTNSAKLATIDELITDATSFRDDLRKQLAEQEQIVAALQKVRVNTASRNGRSAGHTGASTPNRPVKGTMPDLIERVLTDAGHGLGLHEIVERVEKLGASSGAEKGVSVIVSGALSRRRDLFHRVGRGKWDLTKRRSQQEQDK